MPSKRKASLRPWDDGANCQAKAGQSRTECRSDDLISELPDEILHSILSKLPLRDLVTKNSIISQWRKLVVSFLLRSLVDSSSTDSMLGFNRMTKFRFRSNSCHSHDGNGANREKVPHPVHAMHGMPLLRSAVKRIDRTLVIDSSSKLCNFDSNSPILGLSVFQPDLFRHQRQFGSLINLTLCKVPLATYNIESMFRCLENVDTLVMEHCSLPKKLRIGSLPALRRFYLFCPGVKKIQMSNNLKLTDFTCLDVEIEWNLCGAPNLKSLEAPLNARRARSLFNGALRNLPV
ncbi:hypothetical protein Dimus_008608 [Dionaea muscipula]